MSTKEVKLAQLTPMFASREENPNKLSDERFAGLEALMGLEGGLQPILVFRTTRGYTIVDGHHRFWIAQKLGWETMECTIADVEEKARGLALAMNHLRGELDLSLSAEMLRDLFVDTGWSAEVLAVNTGFTAQEVKGLLESAKTYGEDELGEVGAGTAQPDDDASPPDKPFVLEISFSNKDDMRLVRRKLRKAAGASKDLSVGLLHVLGESE